MTTSLLITRIEYESGCKQAFKVYIQSYLPTTWSFHSKPLSIFYLGLNIHTINAILHVVFSKINKKTYVFI